MKRNAAICQFSLATWNYEPLSIPENTVELNEEEHIQTLGAQSLNLFLFKQRGKYPLYFLIFLDTACWFHVIWLSDSQEITWQSSDSPSKLSCMHKQMAFTAPQCPTARGGGSSLVCCTEESLQPIQSTQPSYSACKACLVYKYGFNYNPRQKTGL